MTKEKYLDQEVSYNIVEILTRTVLPKFIILVMLGGQIQRMASWIICWFFSLGSIGYKHHSKLSINCVPIVKT
jgi:hypothetical protein